MRPYDPARGLGPLLLAAVLLIGTAAAAGLHRYMTGEGDRGDVPDRLSGAIARSLGLPDPAAGTRDRWTLVLAANPRCPCTAATARRLAAVLAGATGVDAVILVRTTPGTPEDDPGVLHPLAGLSDVRFVPDNGGATAASLGAHTSGHVLLYDRSGALRFSGGVTPGRGMDGPSAGGDALLAHFEREPGSAGRDTAPVYGCELVRAGAARGEGGD